MRRRRLPAENPASCVTPRFHGKGRLRYPNPSIQVSRCCIGGAPVTEALLLAAGHGMGMPPDVASRCSAIRLCTRIMRSLSNLAGPLLPQTKPSETIWLGYLRALRRCPMILVNRDEALQEGDFFFVEILFHFTTKVCHRFIRAILFKPVSQTCRRHG